MPLMLRPAIERLPASQIRELSVYANELAARGAVDMLKFYVGEGDAATPAFIRSAAIAALEAGDTFYNPNLGLDDLRGALAQYATRLHGRPIGAGRIAVTSAGVNALMLVSQVLLDPGDTVAMVTPVWPNLPAMPAIMSASVRRVPLACRDGRWTLDLQRLLDAARGAKVVCVNSPNNPTGWVMPQADWRELLAFCRREGAWLVSDDAYERLVYDPEVTLGHRDTLRATGVLAELEPDDRFISANTFSKTWSMTGWRLGWLVAPEAFVAQLAKIIEFNTSCAPPFVQRAGIAAVQDGDALVAATRARLREQRDGLLAGLAAIPGVDVGRPAGAMYAFLRVPGSADSVAFARRLVRETGVALAPGVAFGREGEGWLRWCFASSPPVLREGVERLTRFVSAGRAPAAG
jgi:aspartate/methionine/tyrosine aminotransferase